MSSIWDEYITPPVRNLRTALTFFVCYVLLPSASVWYSLKGLEASHAPKEASLNELFKTFALYVVAYLFLAGCVHFQLVSGRLARLAWSSDVLIRILTWDIPCLIWVKSAVWFLGPHFQDDDVGLLLLFTMIITFPIILVFGLVLSYGAFWIMKRYSPQETSPEPEP